MRYALAALLLSWGAFAYATEATFLDDVRQLTFAGKRAGEGYFSADGRQLVFQSERNVENPFYQIYLLDLETGDVDRVSPGYGKTTCAWIHPTEDAVLYASTHEDVDARAKMQEELDFRASGQERRYSWDYDEHFELYRDNRNGERLNLTRTLGYDAEGAWSPDGSKIVFASNRRAYDGSMTEAEAKIFEHDPAYMMDIYLMDADGGNVEQLTDSPGYDGGSFFSADGRLITWRRFSEDGSRAEIFTMDLHTREEKQLTRTGVMSWAPYFHPSGDYLIYASNKEGFANFELFLVDAAGQSEPVRVTTTEGFDGLPVFSPNGEQLAWTSNRTPGKQSQIFIGSWNDAAAREALGISGSHAVDRPRRPLVQTDSAIRITDARAHLERLTADDMEGRLTGTPGEALATRYVADVFASFGLQPGGEDGTFFQAFKFTAGADLSDDNQLEIDGWQGVVQEDWRPLALSQNGRFEAAPVVFAGYGIVAPAGEGQQAYDSYKDLDVTDKWVMVLRFQPEDVESDARRHLLRFADLGYKAAQAKRNGALGIVVVTGPRAAAKDRLVPLRMNATTATTSIAAVSITDEAAQRFFKSRTLEDVQAEFDTGEQVAGFDLDDVSVSAQIDVIRRQHEGRNVIGTLPAANPSGLPPLIYGAHIDHLGRGDVQGSLAKDDESGQIHRGADDNASGVAGLLEAAEYLASLDDSGKLGSVRDIQFVAWSGEELGTLGSTHFVEQLAGHGDLADKVSAYLNMDMIGRVEETAYLQGTGSSSVWASEIERRNVPVGLPVSLSADPYLPTDSTPFYLKRVPVLAAFSGVHEEYSTPRDTADLINYEGLIDITRLMTGIARSLARSTDEPDYVEVEREQTGGRSMMRVYLGTIPSYAEEEGLVGLRLQGAVKGSPAEKAGIEPNDVIVGLAGVDVETIYDFMGAMNGLKAGEVSTVVVMRNGERVELTIIPGTRE